MWRSTPQGVDRNIRAGSDVKKQLSELAALNEEARERHWTYGLLMARTTPAEREKIVAKWRKHYAAGRRKS